MVSAPAALRTLCAAGLLDRRGRRRQGVGNSLIQGGIASGARSFSNSASAILRGRNVWRLFAILAVLLACTPARTQDFPTRPVQIIVPASPAGITDIAARIIGDGLTRLWGRQVVIENRPGGGGTIGVVSVTRATPDGYTLLMTTNGELAMAPAITSKVPYSWDRDLKPIVMATKTS